MRLTFALLASASALLAAPVPPEKEEKPKPRAKLLGTLYQESPVQAVHWTPDGKHVVVVGEGKVLVYPRTAFGPPDQKYPGEKVKPLTTIDRPDRITPDGVQWGTQIGVTADGGVWAVVPAGRRVSAETRLLVWDGKTLLAGGENPKPDRAVNLETDNPLGGVLSADGKNLYATLGKPRTTTYPFNGQARWVYAPRFAHLSGKTGDRRWPRPTSPRTSAAGQGSTRPPAGCSSHCTPGRRC